MRAKIRVVQLRATREQGRQGGDTAAATEVTAEVNDSRDLPVLSRRDADIGKGVYRHEEESQTYGLIDAKHDGRAEIDPKIKLGHMEKRDGTHDEAESDHVASIHLGHEPTDQREA